MSEPVSPPPPPPPAPPTLLAEARPVWIRLVEVLLAAATLSLSVFSFNLSARISDANRRLNAQKIREERMSGAASRRLDEQRTHEAHEVRMFQEKVKASERKRDDARFILEYSDALLSQDVRRRALAMQTLSYALDEDVATVMLAVLLQASADAEREYIDSIVIPSANDTPTTAQFYSRDQQERVAAFTEFVKSPEKYDARIRELFMEAGQSQANPAGVHNALMLMLKLSDNQLRAMSRELSVLVDHAPLHLDGQREHASLEQARDRYEGLRRSSTR